jgi:hypothetical protein
MRRAAQSLAAAALLLPLPACQPNGAAVQAVGCAAAAATIAAYKAGRPDADRPAEAAARAAVEEALRLSCHPPAQAPAAAKE